MRRLFLGIDLGTTVIKWAWIEVQDRPSTYIERLDQRPAVFRATDDVPEYRRNGPWWETRFDSTLRADYIIEPRRKWEKRGGALELLSHQLLFCLMKVECYSPDEINCAITYPPHFDASQRMELRKAWDHATLQFNELKPRSNIELGSAQLASEGLAAAIYYWKTGDKPSRPVVAINLGGGGAHLQLITSQITSETDRLLTAKQLFWEHDKLATTDWDDALARYYLKQTGAQLGEQEQKEFRRFAKLFERDSQMLAGGTLKNNDFRSFGPIQGDYCMERISGEDWAYETATLNDRFRRFLAAGRTSCRRYLELSECTVLMIGSGTKMAEPQELVADIFHSAKEIQQLSAVAVAEGASYFCFCQNKVPGREKLYWDRIRWEAPNEAPTPHLVTESDAPMPPEFDAPKQAEPAQDPDEVTSSIVGRPPIKSSLNVDSAAESTPPPPQDAAAQKAPDPASSPKLGKPEIKKPDVSEPAPELERPRRRKDRAPRPVEDPPTPKVSSSLGRPSLVTRDTPLPPESAQPAEPEPEAPLPTMERVLDELIAKTARSRITSSKNLAQFMLDELAKDLPPELDELNQRVGELESAVGDAAREAKSGQRRALFRGILEIIRQAENGAPLDQLQRQLIRLITAHGLAQIDIAPGDGFFPDRHKATDKIPAPTREHHKTIAEVRGTAWRKHNDHRPYVFANVVVYVWSEPEP